MSAPVTVAVVSWNTRDLLARCLESLAPDADSGLAAVQVVDNGSTDGSRELVRGSFGWAELVEPAENLGFGRAVNLVACRGGSPWLCAANADVALEPGALERLVRTAERHPRAGAVAPRLVFDDGSPQHSVYAFPTLAFSLAFNLGLPRLNRQLADRMCVEGRWDPERPREVDWAIGAFLLLRREAFEAVRGFDERRFMYAEDLALGWALREAGWTTRYEPAAVVRHTAGAAASQAFGDWRADRFMEATYDWMAERRGRRLARATALVNWAGAAGRAAALRPLAAGLRRFREPLELNRRWAAAHRTGLRRAPAARSGAPPRHNRDR